MNPFLSSAPVLAVSAIFCLYNGYRQALLRQLQRQRRLCERIAYMLWVTANGENSAEADDVTAQR
jgi:hypothetical protein